MSAPRIALRAASGPAIGLGHVRRTRAVAQALALLGVAPRVVLDDPASAAALCAEGFDAAAEDEDPAWSSRAWDAAWLDGFRPWSEEIAALRARGARVVAVENRAARERADLVLYPALHFVPDEWDRAHPERVRGGAEWIPLAREVLAAEPRAERDLDLLVTFGGSDPSRLTERVLAALARLETPRRVAATVGEYMAARSAAILDLARPLGAETVAAPSLAPWIARSRAAVTAVGTTLYELAALGTPALVLANHASDAQALEWYAEHGPHRPLGLASDVADADLPRLLADGLRDFAERPPPPLSALAGGARRIALLLATGAG